MTAVPISSQTSSKKNAPTESVTIESTPVLALKELVANLHKEQNKIQNLLSSLSFALRSFNNLNQFLELTPLITARVTDAEGGALILLKPNGQARLEQLHCQDTNKCRSIRPVLEQITRRISSNNSNFESNKKAINSHSWSGYLDEEIRRELGSKVQMFGIPILVKNVERGRLYVFSSDKEYVWTPMRQKLLQLVADQTAVAIANNELTVELRSKQSQDRELEIASEIQLRLLPRECPKIKGVELAADCKTARRIGGDYYDFIPTNYDRLRDSEAEENARSTCVPWSVVIGDVMGKGVPAGLIMTMTRGMLRAEVLNRHSPAKILEHLNRVMYADLENSRRFVTLFYSEYDPKTGILSYSNAAHNPPLLWKAQSGSIQKLDAWGMLIGLDIDSNYEDVQIQLDPGDTIIYYTDGFTEAHNPHGELFGPINVNDILDEENLFVSSFEWAAKHCETAQEILDYLFDRVGKFIGDDNNNSDDMTLVVMKVKSSE